MNLMRKVGKLVTSFLFSLALVLAVKPFAVSAVASYTLPSPQYEGPDYVEVGGAFTTYGYNNATMIDYIEIVDWYWESYTDTIVPQQEYLLRFSVTDYDGVDALTMNLKWVFLDQANETVQQAFTQLTGTNRNGNGFALNPFGVEDELSVRYGTITSLAETSWSIGEEYRSISKDGYTLYMEIPFMASKVAQYDYNYKWAIGLEVTDGLVSPSVKHFAHTDMLNMAWYGQIEVAENQTADFGSVDVNNSSFAANKLEIPNVKFVSNGEYTQSIYSYEYWWSNIYYPGGYGYYEAYLDGTGLVDSSQEFAIIVNYENTLKDLSQNPMLLSGYSWTNLQTKTTKTSEYGVLLNYYLWLKVNSDFQNGTYFGYFALAVGNALD